MTQTIAWSKPQILERKSFRYAEAKKPLNLTEITVIVTGVTIGPAS